MKTALPFSAFQGQKDLPAAVKIPKPFPEFGIGEAGPGIGVDAFEPVPTGFLPGEPPPFSSARDTIGRVPGTAMLYRPFGFAFRRRMFR